MSIDPLTGRAERALSGQVENDYVNAPPNSGITTSLSPLLPLPSLSPPPSLLSPHLHPICVSTGC